MADGGAGWVQIGLQAASMAATGVATGMKIDETISDYNDQIKEYRAKLGSAQAQGAFEMKSTGEANAYNAATTAEKGALSVGSARAGAGFSGVKGQSPLMAIAQAERQSNQATSEAIRSGNSSLEGLGLQYTALTGDYNRAISLAKGKQQYLRDNKWRMVGLASVGGAVDLGNTIINVGIRDWDWGKKATTTTPTT